MLEAKEQSQFVLRLQEQVLAFQKKLTGLGEAKGYEYLMKRKSHCLDRLWNDSQFSFSRGSRVAVQVECAIDDHVALRWLRQKQKSCCRKNDIAEQAKQDTSSKNG